VTRSPESSEVICRRCGSPMVQRRASRGTRQGGFFWGCSRYPSCRETVDIPSIAATPDPAARAAETSGSFAPPAAAEVLPGGGAVIGEAGGSARRTYERRREADDAQRMNRLGKAVPRAVIAAILVGVVTSSWGQALALVFAAVIGSVILLEAIVPRQSTTAWVTGAEGEERTADYLDPLASEGFVIFHDRKIPLSRANVDHIVIGPTGVFVVETKNVAGDFRVRGDDVRIGGRRVAVVDEVRREVDATWNAVAPVLAPKGLRVVPVVCAHRADLPFFRRSVAGIRIVSGRGLARYIRGQPKVLSAPEIQELRRLLVRALPGKG
jgi:ssDNA-binding Zn-finger/Zn-ribbon topoisomerase 1